MKKIILVWRNRESNKYNKTGKAAGQNRIYTRECEANRREKVRYAGGTTESLITTIEYELNTVVHFELALSKTHITIYF